MSHPEIGEEKDDGYGLIAATGLVYLGIAVSFHDQVSFSHGILMLPLALHDAL